MKDKKTFGVKTLAALAAVALALGCVIGGTMAWLTAQTAPVINTFTTSDIGVTLTERTGPSYKMIPGWTITKDPVVTVTTGSEDCWLFVKLDKSTNYETYLEDYTIADGWTSVETDVYARKVTDTTTFAKGAAIQILQGNQITVKSSVTKEQMERLSPSDYPTLTITAYATQLYQTNGVEFSAAEAWRIVNPNPTT